MSSWNGAGSWGRSGSAESRGRSGSAESQGRLGSAELVGISGDECELDGPNGDESELDGTNGDCLRLSGWEALANVRLWFQNRRDGRVSLVEHGLEKIRLSGRECSRRRPSGDRGSSSRTDLDRRVKLGGRKASQSTGSVVG